MRWIVFSFIAVAVAVLGRPAAAQPAAIARVPHCVVTLTEQQADLAPQEAGSIRERMVKEGEMVQENQLLLQLDDAKAQRELDVAEAKRKAAEAKYSAAQINVDYAKAAKNVADAEYQVSQKSNVEVPGSVPKVKMNELFLKTVETGLSISKATSDQQVAKEEAEVAAAEVAAAKLTVERHKIVSPIAGEVLEIHTHKGEAVQPTQAVIRVVRLDSLWVEARVPAVKFARAEIEGQAVTVEFVITRDQKRSLSGQVIFVSPLTDTGDTFLVRAKVENQKVNGSWLLNPGMQAEMDIQLRPLSRE